jgi:hypothetical protein
MRKFVISGDEKLEVIENKVNKRRHLESAAIFNVFS